MIRFSKMSVLSFLLATCWTTTNAAAQFPGDVYFVDPSVTVPEGDTVTVTLASFVGVSAFGSVHTELLFDPLEIEVLEVKSSGASPEINSIAWQSTASGIGIVLSNSKSATRPFGTVELAEITVRPLVPAGSRAFVDQRVVALLDGEVSSFANAEGFGVEFLVTSPNAPATNDGLEGSIGYGGVLNARIEKLRRLGNSLRVFEPSWLGRSWAAEAVWIESFQPNAARDRQ